jgi:hypothetical protein
MLCFASCQDESIELGALQLNVKTNQNTVLTKATPEEIAALQNQIGITIYNSQEKVVFKSDDWTAIQDDILLKPGAYKIEASSALTDGTNAGFDAPYYVGVKEIVISENSIQPVEIECTLANVKVTIQYSEAVKKNFKTTRTNVSNPSGSIWFEREESRSAYFSAEDLDLSLELTNNDGQSFTLPGTVENVKSREHYRITYDVKTDSSGDFEIVLDQTTQEYKVNIKVPIFQEDKLRVTQLNSWATWSQITVSATEETAVAAQIKYRAKGATEWLNVENAVNEGLTFTAEVRDLMPDQVYEYCVVSGEETSVIKEEKTEAMAQVENLSFDDWYRTGKHVFAATEATYKNNTYWWDSGNIGANTLLAKNPTNEETNTIIKGKAAKLASTEVFGVFAAGNIYTGRFSKVIEMSGAALKFGRPFGTRPTQLKGHFKYNPGAVTHTKKDFIQKGDQDSCAIYIMLTDWSAPFDVNTSTGSFVQTTDPGIIAYGEIPQSKCSTPMAAYEEIVIDLKYRSLTRKPTHVLIVASASKYGDYFTGSKTSVLLLDEFELLYGTPVIDPNYINQ